MGDNNLLRLLRSVVDPAQYSGWSRWRGLKWLGVVPLLALVVLLVLRAADVGVVLSVPFLSEILSTIFLSFVYLVVA